MGLSVWVYGDKFLSNEVVKQQLGRDIQRLPQSNYVRELE